MYKKFVLDGGVMSSLSRAQSWPLLSGAAPAEEVRQAAATRTSQIQARRFLCRHYYPEGGWGWVIAVCALLVHVLNHGVQLSCSQLVSPAAFKFQVPPVYPAGISLHLQPYANLFLTEFFNKFIEKNVFRIKKSSA